MNINIITVATKNYLKKAHRLFETAKSFGCFVHIIEVENVHSSISLKGNTKSNAYKPLLIKRFIEKTNSPVIWCDADAIIRNELKLWKLFLEKKYDFGVYNWLNDQYNTLYKPFQVHDKFGNIKNSNRFYLFKNEIVFVSDTQLMSSGFVQFWNNSSSAIQLLTDWEELIRKFPLCADDQLLDCCFNNINRKINFLPLPKSYANLSGWIFEEPIIWHPDLISNFNWPKLEEYGLNRFKRSRITERKSTSVLLPHEILDVKENVIFSFDVDEIIKKRFEGSFHIFTNSTNKTKEDY